MKYDDDPNHFGLFPVVKVDQQKLAYQRAKRASLEDKAIPLLPAGVRVEDRRPVPEMTDRPALMLLACCPHCGLTYIFITSERDTCNYSTTCGRCSKSHT